MFYVILRGRHTASPFRIIFKHFPFCNSSRTKPASNKKNDRLYRRNTHNHIYRPHGLWKTHLVLDLIEREYNKHFDYIIIICPILRWNKTYSKDWIINIDKVWLVEPKDKLYQWIEKLPQLLAHLET